MLTVEEAFELTLIEEGQYLLGEDFIQMFELYHDSVLKIKNEYILFY